MRPERFIVVSARDPAIDNERVTYREIGEYIKTRDEKLIAPMLRAGAVPTKYTVREIPTDLWMRFVESVPEGPEQWARAFQAGVEWVDGLVQADGTRLDRLQGANGDRAMTDQMLNRFRPSEVREIGQVVWAHSFLARSTKCSFVPQDSFLAILLDRQFRPADASQTTPAPSSGEASSAEATEKAPQPPTDHTSAHTESASASPTAATAQAMPAQGSA